MKLTVMLSKKHPFGPKYKKLFPQFAPPETWRTWDFHIVIESKSNAGSVNLIWPLLIF